MLEIVYGTGNQGKITQLQGMLELYDIAVRGIDEFGIELDIEEDGRTVEENARKKALAYAAAVERPVLSMDSGLYFEGIPDALQPGLLVRRFNGIKRATDQQMLTYYTELIEQFGGRLDGYWESAFVIAWPNGAHKALVKRSPRIFVSDAHAIAPEGNPLMALQIDPTTGKRLPDMTSEERAKTSHAYAPLVAAFLKKSI
jgi:XTP/dITP diphosphohydrolase